MLTDHRARSTYERHHSIVLFLPACLLSGLFVLLDALGAIIAVEFFGASILFDLGWGVAVFLLGIPLVQATLRLLRLAWEAEQRPSELPSAFAEPIEKGELGVQTAAPAVEPEAEFEFYDLPGDLTPREAEILLLLAGGSTVAEVSGALFISVHTVTRHISNTYAKIGARNRAEAISWAMEAGIVPGRPGSGAGNPSEAFAEFRQAWR